MHQSLAQRKDPSSRPNSRHRILGILAAVSIAFSLIATGSPASAQGVEDTNDCDVYFDDHCQVEEPEQTPELVSPAEYPKPGSVTAGMAILPDMGGWINAWANEIQWIIGGVKQAVQWDEGSEFGSDQVGGHPFTVPISAIGKTLLVRVLMEDGLGKTWVDEFDLGIVKAKTFTAAPIPTVSGSHTVGGKLTANAGNWAPKATIAYQWYRNGALVSGATAQTYTLTAADANTKIKVRTRATASGVTTVERFSAERSIGAAQFSNAPNPSITGTASVGNTLKLSVGSWSPTPTFGYQWYRNNAAIKGATKSSFATTSADLNKSLKVRVTAKRDGYPTTTRDSSARKITVGKLNAGSKLTVSGTTRSGSTISASVTAPAGSKATYQWYKNGKKVAKATNKSHKLSSRDIGAKYQVRVTFTRAGYSKLSMNSNTVKIGKPTFAVTSTPKISGTKKSGSTLKATAGTYTPKPASYSYQWLRNGKSISKATKSSYKLTSTDNGKKISVKVTAKKNGHDNKSATSSAVSIPEPPKPLKTVISKNGTYKVGTQVKPGLYKATGTGNSCYWERLDGFSGSLDDINANHFGSANVYVQITSRDVGFKTEGCGSWKQVSNSGAKSSTISKDGNYRVGIDIKPGLYQGSGGGACYWANLDGFTGDLDDIIENDFTYGLVVVDIPSWSTGFEKSGCGTLRRIGQIPQPETLNLTWGAVLPASGRTVPHRFRLVRFHA